jgi:predicted dehydrogenase
VDYTSQPFGFKLRKAARYVRLYGPRRTRVKAKAYYHMRKTYDQLPARRENPHGHVGLIGCGKFAYSNLAYYLTRDFGRVIRGVMDVDVHRAASLFEKYGAAYYTDQSDEIIRDPRIDVIYIASNHASHAGYAIDALDAGKSVHIEKPHVVCFDQLVRLREAMARSRGRVTLGFNRPYSSHGEWIRATLASQDGPAMMNWFIAAHDIPPDHWYFSEAEGGRVLGNLCHWTDFVYQMVAPDSRYPITIVPVRASERQNDIVVSYVFGDESLATITFSAKGHAFEGVKERFAAHRGDALITMDDFKTMTIQVGASKKTYGLRTRDHGHRAMVRRTYEALRGAAPAAAPSYVWETGELFLRTKEALDNKVPITTHPARAQASAVA